MNEYSSSNFIFYLLDNLRIQQCIDTWRQNTKLPTLFMFAIISIFKVNPTYLKLGLGDAWAGQIIVVEVCNFLWIDLDRSSEGNFGGEPPTGSVAYKHWYCNFQLECCDYSKNKLIKKLIRVNDGCLVGYRVEEEIQFDLNEIFICMVVYSSRVPIPAFKQQ